MKVYNLPQKIYGIIFDIDSTLYTNPFYAFEQVDIQVRHFAHLRGMAVENARFMLNAWRKKWSGGHGGKKISLGNTLLNFGISIEESIKWRRELLEPSYYLKRDERLIACLKEMKKHFALVCVTNNPVLPAKKTLKAIGIDGIITDIVGLDTCFLSKPAIEPFTFALRIMGIDAKECVSVGDRYDMDIALPVEMGMGGVLVAGVEEVLSLEKVLA